jgi:uncharacterized protein YecE (DUF72 family)
MARAAGVAIVFADAADYPCIPDLSGSIVYARLQRCIEEEATGYGGDSLDRWASIATHWSRGESPAGFPYAAEAVPPKPRDTYVFFISGAKVRAPLAARGLIERL